MDLYMCTTCTSICMYPARVFELVRLALSLACDSHFPIHTGLKQVWEVRFLNGCFKSR